MEDKNKRKKLTEEEIKKIGLPSTSVELKIFIERMKYPHKTISMLNRLEFNKIFFYDSVTGSIYYINRTQIKTGNKRYKITVNRMAKSSGYGVDNKEASYSRLRLMVPYIDVDGEQKLAQRVARVWFNEDGSLYRSWDLIIIQVDRMIKSYFYKKILVKKIVSKGDKKKIAGMWELNDRVY